MNKPERPKAMPTVAEMVQSIVSDIVEMESTGNCRAIAAVVIDKDGDVHRLSAYGPQTDLVMLMGGTVALQHKLVRGTRPGKKETASLQ